MLYQHWEKNQKKEQTIVDASSLAHDPRGLENFSWFLENRTRHPWMAKVYYLENYTKLAFISEPSSDKRGVYLIDFDRLAQKNRMIKLKEYPFIDIAIHAEKQIAFVLKGDKKSNNWAIEIVSNSNLFKE